MMCLKQLPIIVLFIMNVSQGKVENELTSVDLLHYMEMGKQGEFILGWTPRDKDILFQVQVKSEGYFGLGFSPTGGMKGADIVIGWFNEDGKGFIKDCYAIAKETPIEDESSDYSLIFAHKNNTHMTMRFLRDWNTGDQNDFLLSSDTVRIIWAIGDVERNNKVSHLKHKERGTRNTLLTESNPMEIPKGPHIKYYDILAKNFSLPSHKHTEYWCFLQRIPELQTKHHIVAIMPQIVEKNSNIVHHIILRECVNIDKNFVEHYSKDDGFGCYLSTMPPEWNSCLTVIAAWAVGSNGDVLPEHVGYPIGGEEDHKYFAIEIHYDNPEYQKGVVDSSGLRLYYTDELRQYDAGIMTVGHQTDATHIIPKGQLEWKSTAFCNKECLSQQLSSSSVRIFGVLLHTHLIGKKIKLRHFRNNKELPIIVKDDAYDFNYQQGRILKSDREVFPNDTLMVECVYDSTKRESFTLGGEATIDEMCYVFVMYYPWQSNASFCISSPSIENMKNTVHFHENKLTKDNSMSARAYYNYVKDGKWTSSFNIEELKNNIVYGEQREICILRNGVRRVNNIESPMKYLMFANESNDSIPDLQNIKNEDITVTIFEKSSGNWPFAGSFIAPLSLIMCLYEFI